MNQPRSLPGRRRPGGAVGAVSLALAAVLALTACGGSSAGVTVPKVAPAGTYSLQHFQPAGPVVAGRSTTLSFTIQQPSGRTLAAYRPCCEPHDGVDLIIVRSDDSHIQYSDSDISPSGHVTQPIVFPTPGRYRVIVDAYPAHTTVGAPINFQLFTWVTVSGQYRQQTLPPYHATEVVDGYRFQIQPHPVLKAIQATFLTIKSPVPMATGPCSVAGEARWPIRSSSTRARWTTFTPTCAVPGRSTAPRYSGRPR